VDSEGIMMTITLNECNWDRILRVALGLILIAAGIAVWGVWGIVLGLVGIIPLLTGIIGWCPLYALFKIQTCKR